MSKIPGLAQFFKFWQKSLMRRLVGAFLLLSLLIISLVGYLAYAQARESLKQSVFDRLNAVASLKEDSLNRWVDEQRRNVVFMAWLPEVRSMAGALTNQFSSGVDYQDAYSQLGEYLLFMVTNNSDSQELFILDLQGNILVSTDKSHEGLSQKDAVYFVEGQSKTFVQKVYTSEFTNRPIMTVATPLFDTNRRRIGVLAGHLNMARVDRIILDRVGLGQSGETYLVDPAHTFVSASRNSQEGASGQAALHSKGIEAALQGNTGSDLYLNYSGSPVIGVYHWLDERGIALIAEMGQAEAFAPAQRLAWSIFLIGLFSAVGLAGGVYLLARQIARPILAVNQAAGRVSAGDLSQTAPVLTEDEVGTLAQTFNQMTGQLRQLYESLEKQVAERTADLTDANRQLKQEISERTLAEEALRKQNEYLAALHETTLGLMTRLDLNELLEALVARAGQLLDTSHGFIHLSDPYGAPITQEGAVMELKVGVGMFSEQVGLRQKPGDGLAGTVWQAGQPVVVADYDTWERRLPHFGYQQIRAVMGVPLTQGAGGSAPEEGSVEDKAAPEPQIVGVLGLAYSAGSDRTFGDREVELLTRFAHLASLALDNARLYQAARQAVAEAEAANRAKSTFLANMSHELRTPLNAILGFTRIVKRKGEGLLPDKQIDNLEKVLASANHLLGLINAILDIAKIEAGRMEVEPVFFSMEELLDECLTTTQPLVNPEVVSLEKEIEPGFPLIFSDPEKIKQILLNLLANAAKFTQRGRIRVSVSRQERRMIVSVEDTGVGIKKEALDMIFEEFRQGDSSTTRQYGGTGLGLAISRRLASLLEGEISVASTEGEGSTFILRLPLQFGDQAVNPSFARQESTTGEFIETVASATVDSAPIATGKPVILAIDDDPDVVYLLQENLSEAGYQVVGALSGEVGVKKAIEVHPMAITLDIKMPDKDGWQVLHDLKSNPATCNIPVILLTIVDRKPLGYQLGAADYLVKPLDTPAVLRALNRLTEVYHKSPPFRLLVVDDDPNVIDMVRQLLAGQPYEVEVAGNGLDAIQAVQASPPDILLLDLMLPELDGFHVVERLREKPETCQIPIVVLTAKILEKEEIARLQERVSRIIQKQGLEAEMLIRELQIALVEQAPKP